MDSWQTQVTAALIDAGVLAPVYMGDPRDRVVKQVLAYIPEDAGSAPSDDFLSSLETSSMPIETVAYDQYLAMMVQHSQGSRLPRKKYHHWDNGLADYKHIGSKTRIILMIDGPRVILLRGVRGKKEDKIDQGEVTRAERMKDEYLRRKSLVLKKAGLTKDGGPKDKKSSRTNKKRGKR